MKKSKNLVLDQFFYGIIGRWSNLFSVLIVCVIFTISIFLRLDTFKNAELGYDSVKENYGFSEKYKIILKLSCLQRLYFIYTLTIDLHYIFVHGIRENS